MMISFGPGACGSLDESSKREWLVTDGVGGYAMGTVAGLRTRRYHGLLITAVGGPAARMIGLAALDAVLIIGDSRIRLSTHEWGDGTVDPRGHELLAEFVLDRGVPRWRWQVGGTILERELAMAHGRSAVGVVHRLVRADQPVRLELTPLCTWRSVHGERFANGDPAIQVTADGFVFENSYRVVGPGWTPSGAWYRGVRWREEAARGLSAHEDLWAAGTFSAPMQAGGTLEISAAAAPFADPLPRAGDLVREARARADDLVTQAGATDPVDRQLVLAADQFVIDGAGGPTAVAGYPWFGEWSRDLMTSYEGLFLATNRVAEGRDTLRRAAATVSEGMLANTADTGTLEYNTADGTLWFVHAIGRHLAAGGDRDLAAELAPTVRAIIDGHIAGTRFGISVDPADGLLRQGAQGWALTWMDARIDGRPVTPRDGKAVEINALWIEALAVAQRLLASTPSSDSYAALRTRATPAFRSRFVRSDGGGLYDVVDGSAGDDASTSAEPAACRVAARRASRGRRLAPGGTRDCQRLRARAPDADRPPVAGPGRSRVPRPAPWWPSPAGCRVPPGNGLAVAAGALCRCGSPGWRAHGRPARRDRGPPRRMGPRLDFRDGRWRRPAWRHRLSVPGVVRRGGPAGSSRAGRNRPRAIPERFAHACRRAIPAVRKDELR